MANIALPSRFKLKLDVDQKLDSIVKKTLADFGEILEDNKLYFFSEYTDHGIKHIENVIASSDNLIPNETFDDVLLPNDIAYYILTVILHDIGMHINLDGFEILINGKFDDVRIDFFDKHSWRDLWEDFINESKKFSGKQLKSIFGDENTVVRVPPLSKRGEINENDKKLIGEFLRRNHPRLAHEVALKGFPGKPKLLEFANELSKEIRDIIGLIARSHGLGLRKSVDYLEEKHGKSGKRFPFSTHAVYLMVLLRIADYIQINSGRTSKTLLKLKTFSSPISENEHNAHLAIDYIDDRYQDDPERIYVTASPNESSMFLKLKNLIKSIQYEFDISWAVLGEVYGQHSNKLEIKYRRITSNLEEEKFINSQKYIADTFYFNSNDEIIKLLIAPLYGDDPKYGIRELLQNAIDACKEREEIEKKAGNLSYTPSIEISIENKKEPFLTIVDNGIGMDAEIIKNYFLSAGSSFRKSIEWQKEFQDDKGDTIIRRSGRFGVGILAAFLIGKEIYVETRKYNNIVGYKFQADLRTEQINILKDEKILEGTTIKIKIKNDAIEKLKPKENSYYVQWFQWFTLSNPSIKYSYFKQLLNPYNNLDPDINNLPKDWNAIDYPGFNKILWTYSSNYSEAEFTCNGIIIPHDSYPKRAILNLGLIRNRPRLSIFDNNAFAPITLDRNSFSSELPFNKELLIDIYKDLIAYVLVYQNISIVKDKSAILINNNLNHPGLTNDYRDYYDFSYGSNIYGKLNGGGYRQSWFLNRILVSKMGFILDYNYFINRIKDLEVLLIQSNDYFTPHIHLKIDLRNKFLSFVKSKLNSIDDYINAIEAKEFDFENGEIKPFNARVFIKSEKFNFLTDSSKKRISRWLNDKLNVHFHHEGWTCVNLDKPGKTIITDAFLKNYANTINFIREYKIECSHEGDEILNALLKRYIGDNVIIPFSIDERKKKYPLAFVELERYMEKYLK